MDEQIMDPNVEVRYLIRKVMYFYDAHVNFDMAIEDIPPDLRGVRPHGLPYSIWTLVEHMRRIQADILDYFQNPAYEEPNPEDYWPPSADMPTPDAWDKSVTGFKTDLDTLQQLVRNQQPGMFESARQGRGLPYARKLMHVVDHNAYHVGQIVLIRRLLGIWTRSHTPFKKLLFEERTAQRVKVDA